MIALSVHATFEGIALGLQMTLAQTLNIVVAVVIHKGAASSALGISLVKVFPNDFTLVRYLILIFSFATPLGVVIASWRQVLATLSTLLCRRLLQALSSTSH